MSSNNSPEFFKALNKACEKQYRGYLFGGDYAKAHSKDIISDTMEGMQRKRRKIESSAKGIRIHAEQARRKAIIKTNPHMREITSNIRRRSGSSGLICPVCGEGDHGNRMGRKPYCFMNAKHGELGPVPLMTPEKAKEWKPPEKQKTKSLTYKELDGVVKRK